MDLDFKDIAHLFKTGSDPAVEAVKPIDRLRSLMTEANVTDAELQKVVADKGRYAADAPIDTIPRSVSPTGSSNTGRRF